MMSHLHHKAATVGRGRRRTFCVVLAFSATACFAHSASAQTRPQWQLWKLDADGGGLARFADTPGYSCGSPDWSPDGKLVAYDTWPVEKTWSDSQIAIVPADGSAPPRLLGHGAMPSFSPDGTQLVCHTYGNPQTIDVINADGSGRETIIDHWGSPRWSPRGNRIATIFRDGGIGLFDLSTGIERSILPGRHRYDVRPGFCISPDGLQFCFGTQDGGVYLATLDEQKMQATVRQLLDTGTCYHASFSPDGKRIVFGWQQIAADPHDQIYILDLDAAGPPVWLEGQNRTRRNVNPAWSPDGKTIVFSSQLPEETPPRTQP